MQLLVRVLILRIVTRLIGLELGVMQQVALKLLLLTVIHRTYNLLFNELQDYNLYFRI